MIYKSLHVSSCDQICEEISCGSDETLEQIISQICVVARQKRRTIILVMAMNARMKTM